MNGIIVIIFGEVNPMFWTDVGVDNHILIAGENERIAGGLEEQGGHAAVSGIGDRIKLWRYVGGGEVGGNPEIEPAEPAHDELTERRRIVKNHAGNQAMCGDIERRSCANAVATDKDWFSCRSFCDGVVSR